MLDHYSLRCCDEAFASFDKEIDLDPNDAWTWFFPVMDLSSHERHDEALASYDDAIDRGTQCRGGLTLTAIWPDN